jgi:hypothetical protein
LLYTFNFFKKRRNYGAGLIAGRTYGGSRKQAQAAGSYLEERMKEFGHVVRLGMLLSCPELGLD